MIEVRCDRHKHCEVDPATGLVVVKCQQCSAAMGYPVFHRVYVRDGEVEVADPDDSLHIFSARDNSHLNDPAQ